jgi:hypothetical protein
MLVATLLRTAALANTSSAAPKNDFEGKKLAPSLYEFHHSVNGG